MTDKTDALFIIIVSLLAIGFLVAWASFHMRTGRW